VGNAANAARTWPPVDNGGMQASILHVDLDAFFASVEQRDKPSLRGKPVIVGGIGQRGVVATASYEARAFGVRSAMRTSEARARCPHAAFLAGRFAVYRAASRQVMDLLTRISPVVEPLSLDEAYVDLAEAGITDLDGLATTLRADIADVTGGLTASVGIASSKLMAKIGSERHKPDGHCIVDPGTEAALLAPMPVTAIPGVGPATAERLRRLAVATVAQLREIDADELVRTFGESHGRSLWRLARALDDRPVTAERETKSLSVEDTFESDLTDRAELADIVERMSRTVVARLQRHGWSARTVTLKARRHDFETLSRSSSLAAPTDSAGTISSTARTLLDGIDVGGGLRLIGVGLTGLADWVQPDLFAEPEPPAIEPPPLRRQARRWMPGQDVSHAEHGPGWVWGSGRGLVTVRFETRGTPPGPVMTFPDGDPSLSPR
jgi:DNA polymerase-4